MVRIMVMTMIMVMMMMVVVVTVMMFMIMMMMMVVVVTVMILNHDDDDGCGGDGDDIYHDDHVVIRRSRMSRCSWALARFLVSEKRTTVARFLCISLPGQCSS